MTYRKIIKDGLIENNPTFIQVLGMCPTLAITTSVANGIGMGLSATAVLIGSNVVVSLLRRFIPDKVRIPAFVVIIATFVTLIQMLLEAFLPGIYKSLGLFIPLIVVNCIILARAEAFASKNKPLPSALDGLATGLGFTAALTVISAIREILGNGTILGFALPGLPQTIMMSLPPGGFLTLGILMAVAALVMERAKGEGKRGAGE